MRGEAFLRRRRTSSTRFLSIFVCCGVPQEIVEEEEEMLSLFPIFFEPVKSCVLNLEKTQGVTKILCL